MSYVGQAIALAAEVHQLQTDKGGKPYIEHCLEVMRRSEERYLALPLRGGVKQSRPEVMAAAVLHDTLEDFEGSPIERKRLRDLIYHEFGDLVYDAVDTLTKHDDEPYDEYIERVSKSWLARLIKLCDLSHNLEAWRIPSGKITEKDYTRWDKYHRAFVRLMRED